MNVQPDPSARVRQFIAGELSLAELQEVPKSAQYAMAQLGFALWREGKLEKAKAIFEGLAALDPADAYFHLMLGSIAQRMENFPAAEARYTRALALKPYSPVAYTNRGECRLNRGDLSGAALDLARALAVDPAAREPTTLRARMLAAEVVKKLPRLAKVR